tara:strand:- start:1 stop:189 length:189 start_codon:yes stop_codon:yes gene_type:complete
MATGIFPEQGIAARKYFARFYVENKRNCGSFLPQSGGVSIPLPYCLSGPPKVKFVCHTSLGG